MTALPSGLKPAAEPVGESIGVKVENWYCYGMPTARLSPELRAKVLDFAHSFEECAYSREELAAMDDEGVIGAAYWAMRDYARGQL